jgi:hypothetical protein
MAGYIEVGSPTGNTNYAMLRNALRQVWNGSTFEAYNVAHWATYVIPLTEDAQAGFYTAAVPAGISSAMRLTIVVYQQLGGSPAAGDDFIGNATGLWDGSSWESGWSTAARTLTSMSGFTVDVGKINGVAAAAIQLSISAQTIVSGLAQTGTLTVAQMTTNLPSAVSKFYVGRVVYFTSGSLAGQVAAVADYDGTTKKITFFSSLTSAPANGDGFVLV